MDTDGINKTQEFEIFYEQFSTKGYVRQYTISKSGNELSLHILKPISYFPMVWAINGTPNVYFFEALTPVEVGRAPKEQVVNFIKDKPSLLFELMSELLEDYAETLTRVEHLVFSDAYRRVISILLYIAKHFGEQQKNNSTIVHHRFTQQDIATLVGVVRETAGIELAKLEKKGLIKYIDRSILFENIDKLTAELSSYHLN